MNHAPPFPGHQFLQTRTTLTNVARLVVLARQQASAIGKADISGSTISSPGLARPFNIRLLTHLPSPVAVGSGSAVSGASTPAGCDTPITASATSAAP